MEATVNRGRVTTQSRWGKSTRKSSEMATTRTSEVTARLAVQYERSMNALWLAVLIAGRQAAQPLTLAPADPCQPPSVIQGPFLASDYPRAIPLASSPGAVLVEHEPVPSWSLEFTARRRPGTRSGRAFPECVVVIDMTMFRHGCTECSVADAKSILTGLRCPVPHSYLHMTYVNRPLLSGSLRGPHILTPICQRRAFSGLFPHAARGLLFEYFIGHNGLDATTLSSHPVK